MEVVEALYAQGATIDLPDLKPTWEISSETAMLLDVCLQSHDVDLAQAAIIVGNVAQTFDRNHARFDAYDSIARWEKLISGWTAGSCTSIGPRRG